MIPFWTVVVVGAVMFCVGGALGQNEEAKYHWMAVATRKVLVDIEMLKKLIAAYRSRGAKGDERDLQVLDEAIARAEAARMVRGLWRRFMALFESKREMPF